jgi:hypothetical protein
MATDSPDYIQVRLPRGLWTRVAAMGALERRTGAAQLAVLVEQALTATEGVKR